MPEELVEVDVPEELQHLLRWGPKMKLAWDEDRKPSDNGKQASAWWPDRLPCARRLMPAGDPEGMLEALRA